MKKVLLLICLVGMSMSAFAQEEKPEASKPASPQMSALMTASSLAKYGYANSSPTALIEAARIFWNNHPAFHKKQGSLLS